MSVNMLVTALLTIITFIAGDLSESHPYISMMMTIPAGMLLMLVWTLRQLDKNSQSLVRPARDGELTLGQLKDSLTGTDDGLVLYHENPFAPIAGWFFARIGGRTVLVMERSHQD